MYNAVWYQGAFEKIFSVCSHTDFLLNKLKKKLRNTPLTIRSKHTGLGTFGKDMHMIFLWGVQIFMIFRLGTWLTNFRNHSSILHWKLSFQSSKQLTHQRKIVRQFFQTTRLTNRWDDYHRSLTSYNKAVRRAKRLSFRGFLQRSTSQQ